MLTNTRRRSLLAVAGASAGIASVLTPAAAHAAAPVAQPQAGTGTDSPVGKITTEEVTAAPAGCAAGALCVYNQLHYGGNRYQFFGSNASWGAWAVEDNNLSWFNNGTSGRWARIWENRGYGGSWHAIARGVGVWDGSPNGANSPVYKRGSSNDWPAFANEAPAR
jgi:Peptidase inhibitor family I36